jgi:hypothetical protein
MMNPVIGEFKLPALYYVRMLQHARAMNAMYDAQFMERERRATWARIQWVWYLR